MSLEVLTVILVGISLVAAPPTPLNPLLLLWFRKSPRDIMQRVNFPGNQQQAAIFREMLSL